MLITISDAAIYLECSKSKIFLDKKYKDKIIKKNDECYIEEKDLRYFRVEQDKINHTEKQWYRYALKLLKL